MPMGLLCFENLHVMTGILTLDNSEFQSNFSMYVYEKFIQSKVFNPQNHCIICCSQILRILTLKFL